MTLRTKSEAFVVQAKSDLDAYFVLAGSRLPASHRLHYVQMWLEKLCKAYLWLPDVHAEGLRGKHNVVEKVLPRLVVEHWRRVGFTRRPDVAAIRELCCQVDLLHPQVDDDGRRPDNVEYPWIGASGDAEIPSQWAFELAPRLYSNAGRLLVKAAVHLTQKHALFLPSKR